MNECIAYLDSEGAWHPVPYEELIRCKDCEYHRNRINMCDIWHRHTNADGFCHRAKSKEQNAKCKAEE